MSGCISSFVPNTGSIHGVHNIHKGLGGVRWGRRLFFAALYFEQSLLVLHFVGEFRNSFEADL